MEQFLAIMLPLVSVQQNKMSSIIVNSAMKEIFALFDHDKNGTINTWELANCMSILGGGSKQSKIASAFLLFDQDNSS